MDKNGWVSSMQEQAGKSLELDFEILIPAAQASEELRVGDVPFVVGGGRR